MLDGTRIKRIRYRENADKKGFLKTVFVGIISVLFVYLFCIICLNFNSL